MPVERAAGGTSLIDVLDRVLDKGIVIDAWVRVRGDTPDARREARARFLVPLLAHYAASAPGQLGEIADGDAPHAPGGCPMQAWSVGEVLRVAEGIPDARALA